MTTLGYTRAARQGAAGPTTDDGRRINAYCSRLVEKGDTLIDNHGEHYLAAGPAKHTRFDTGTEYAVPVLTGHAFSELAWKPVDDFRYGKRIERSN